MSERVVRRVVWAIATVVAALVCSAPLNARVAEAVEHHATGKEAPRTLIQRARSVGASVADLACDSYAWTTTNLSPSAIKARTSQTADAARARWMRALFEAQCELESTLGLFEVESIDAQGRARWQRIPVNRAMPRRVTLLLHGLDDPGNVWDDAAPAIWLGYDPAAPVDPSLAEAPCAGAGCHVVRLDYPNDQAIGRSADLLISALAQLRAAGAVEVDIVAHSMGGLVARDALSRPSTLHAARADAWQLPRVPHMILLGTPSQGSYLAYLRWVMEIRDCAERFACHEPRSWPILLTGLVDGDGEAGADLLPGSEFLKELNSRPPLTDTRITLIEGDYSSGYQRQALELLECLGPEDSWLGCVRSHIVNWTRRTTGQFGDGAVPDWSIPLPGVEDHVRVEADHRSMIARLDLIEQVRWVCGGPERRPPAIEIILDRLARPAPGAQEPDASAVLHVSEQSIP